MLVLVGVEPDRKYFAAGHANHKSTQLMRKRSCDGWVIPTISVESSAQSYLAILCSLVSDEKNR